MKKLLAISLLAISLIACKKTEPLEPVSVQPTQNLFSGVVFIQLDASTVNTYNYGVKKVVAPSTGVYLLPTTGSNGISSNLRDSLPVNFQSGDSIHVGAWKDGNEPFIEPYSGTGNINYKIRTKVYFNGILLHDTISINGQYWFKRLP